MSRIGNAVKAVLQAGTAVIGKLAANDGVDIGDVGVKDIAGVTPQMDDTDKLAVSAYAKQTAAGDTPLLLDTGSNLCVVVRSLDDDTGVQVLAAAGDNSSNSYNLLITDARGMRFNGSTWDRARNNIELTLLASAARTATTNTTDQVNYNHRGLILFVDVTARAASTTLTPNLQVKEVVGGNYITVWTAAAAINSSDTTIAYLFYPSALADAAELYTESVDLTIGRTWRIAMTHSDTDSITYSVSAAMIL